MLDNKAAILRGNVRSRTDGLVERARCPCTSGRSAHHSLAREKVMRHPYVPNGGEEPLFVVRLSGAGRTRFSSFGSGKERVLAHRKVIQ